MKRPAVIIHFRNGLVSSVESVKDAVAPSEDPQRSEQRRQQARTKTPQLALSPTDVPSATTADTAGFLSCLDDPHAPVPRYLCPGEVVAGVTLPHEHPMVSYLITLVEWALRPGDSRVEAYFVASGSRSHHWFLMSRTLNDLEPWRTHYSGGRTVAMVDKKGVTPEAAAVLLLRCAWEHERDHHGLHVFFLVDDDGLLDRDTVEHVASLVWPEEVEL